jgi:two-component system, NtrC family, response regulator HydG
MVATMLQARMLIVDDDHGMRETLQALFSSAGYACELAADATAALDILDRQVLDVIVSDVRMAGMDGLELLDRVKRSHPTVPFIVITAAGATRQAVDAIKRGAFEYVVKPCDSDDLCRIVNAALETRPPQSGTNGRRSQPAPPLLPSGNLELVGSSVAMSLLQTAIDSVAQSSAPVLITGETGVGKELVARAIHARGQRGQRPFVAVNTSAIPNELLEGELFGHVKGGFTGAVQPRKGLFIEADGGTLLLDEIGDMSFGLQAKILRVLQFGDVRPVGSDRTHHVDVRVIAATHRDLPALVKEGRFRQDLYYRLFVLPVFVPPLRDRREDIPALAAHFLAEARARTPRSPVRSIGHDALRELCESSWPGNVRELASAIERAVVFGTDEFMEVRALGPLPEDAPSATWPCKSDAPWTLRQLNRAYAEWVLRGAGGNKEQAAQLLGIDLSTLYRWQRAQHD